MRREIAALLVSALAIAPLGCGGGADGRAPTVHVAKATFLKRAEATCIKTYDRIKADYQEFIKKAPGEPFSTPTEIREYADTVLIPAKQQEVSELRRLGAPNGDEDKVEAILAAYEDSIAKAEEDPNAAVTSTFGVFVKATELAEEYGLKECHY
jgi:hypothetical protein